ncbi:MAG: transposase [Armatimonadetes bacterium]|nr:transposase [Armatimonadota bacterium]
MGVFLAYASPQGRPFLDRELYLPREWAEDAERRKAAGVPEEIGFATKPELARRMLARAFAAGVPAAWVTADTVYGNDRRLRMWLEEQRQPFVLEVACQERVWAWQEGGPRQIRGDHLARQLPASAWSRKLSGSAGWGAKGPRLYDWARFPLFRMGWPPGWEHWLLLRRSIRQPEEFAYYVVFVPEGIPKAFGTRRGEPLEDRGVPGECQRGDRVGPVRGPEVGRVVSVHHPGATGPCLPDGAAEPGYVDGRKGGISQRLVCWKSSWTRNGGPMPCCR